MKLITENYSIIRVEKYNEFDDMVRHFYYIEYTKVLLNTFVIKMRLVNDKTLNRYARDVFDDVAAAELYLAKMRKDKITKEIIKIIKVES